MIAKRKEKEMLEMTLKRLLHRVPKRMRDDPVVQHRIKLYTKLGKERLAREYIKALTLKFPETTTLVTNPIDPPLGEEIEDTPQAEGKEGDADTQNEADAKAEDSNPPADTDSDQPAPEASSA